MSKQDSIVESVINQLRQRSAVGIAKYGTTLAENNSDDFLEHLKQELMDATLYIEKEQSNRDVDTKGKFTKVVSIEGNWGRDGFIHLFENNVIFDTSDGEYGPVSIPLELLKQKIREHEHKKSVLLK